MKLIKRILQIILGIICITPFVLGVGAGIYFMLGVIIHEIPNVYKNKIPKKYLIKRTNNDN
ncbi:MAG TPA: hypothetical protein PLI22_02260 [Caldisericia bacterium]|nr:hypothetical protein [Caldisericia bacterium]